MPLPLKLIFFNLIWFGFAVGGEQHHATEEHHQHASHLHGYARLNLVYEGQELQMELLSPAANIVGFEYAPATAFEHAAFDAAMKKLKRPAELFDFSEAGACKSEQVEVNAAVENDQTHNDIEAFYQFHCHQSAALVSLHVRLFQQFPGLEQIEVSYVFQSRQGAKTLTRDKSELTF